MPRIEREIATVLGDLDKMLTKAIAALVVFKSPKVTLQEALNQVKLQPQKLIREGRDWSGAPPNGELQYRFIIGAIVSARDAISGIELERVRKTKAGQASRLDLFDDKIDAAISSLTYSGSGISNNVIQILQNQNHEVPLPNLDLLNEVRDQSKLVIRRLERLKSPFLAFLSSWRPAFAAIFIAIFLAPVLYINSASKASQLPADKAIARKLSTDTAEISAKVNAPDKSFIEKAAGATVTVWEMISFVPKLLTGLSLLLGFVKYALIDFGWRKRGLNGFRGDLKEGASALALLLDSKAEKKSA